MSFKILYTADLYGNKGFYKKLIYKAKENKIRAIVIGGDLCPRAKGAIEEAIGFQTRLNCVVIEIDNLDVKYMEI